MAEDLNLKVVPKNDQATHGGFSSVSPFSVGTLTDPSQKQSVDQVSQLSATPIPVNIEGLSKNVYGLFNTPQSFK